MISKSWCKNEIEVEKVKSITKILVVGLVAAFTRVKDFILGMILLKTRGMNKI